MHLAALITSFFLFSFAACSEAAVATYDLLGRLAHIEYADGTRIEYRYDANGNILDRIVRKYRTITTVSEPPEGGSTTGGGVYPVGWDVSLEADPAAGYFFSHWARDGVFFSDSSQTGFTVSHAETYTAYFIRSGPEIVIEDQLEPPSTILTDGNAAVSYGAHPLHSEVQRTFMLRNAGSEPLTGIRLNVDGPNMNMFLPSAIVGSVPPRGSTSFSVRYIPASAGSHQAVLHVMSNDADEGSFEIGLSGTGIGSNNADLASLSLSAGHIVPAFSPDQQFYSTTVARSVTQVSVSATTADPDAHFTVNGQPATPSTTATLSLGYNLIQILVTASDRVTSKNYTLGITRSITEPMAGFETERWDHTATLMSDGKILIAGGYTGSAHLRSTQMYDPETGRCLETGLLNIARSGYTANLLPDGRIFVAGGTQGNQTTIGELFNPITGAWSVTGGIASSTRLHHTSTLLPDSSVLIAGGFNGAAMSSVQIYNPVTGLVRDTGSLNAGRLYHTATLLPSGKVLVVGGMNGNGGNSMSSAELYDPVAGVWSPASSMVTARYGHSATLLANGQVLVAGGWANGGAALRSAELYEPATDQWNATGSMYIARTHASATRLPSGEVLISGGKVSNFVYSPVVELYSPFWGTWNTIGQMETSREKHTATLLPSGAVLFAGGFNGSAIATVELYVPPPPPGTWSLVQDLAAPRHSHTATLLPDQRVLVAGGFNLDGYPRKAELYNPLLNLWENTGELNVGRRNHTATLLPNGKVLVAGGYSGGPTSSAELYDRTTGLWSNTGSLAFPRESHTATLLFDGKVLVAGGTTWSGIDLPSMELYNPANRVWTGMEGLLVARKHHTATLLKTGKVLFVGGTGADGAGLSSAEIFDPVLNSSVPTGSLKYGRTHHTATLLPTGRVLVAGGESLLGGATVVIAELFDPAEGEWSETGSLVWGRSLHSANLLSDGRVLVAGGNGPGLERTELYEPSTGDWSFGGYLNGGCTRHTATLLADGGVLVAGGSFGAGAPHRSVERYTRVYGTSPNSHPVIQSASPMLIPETSLLLSGSRFRGTPGGSSGNAFDSATDYPLVQIRSLGNEQTVFLSTNPFQPWTNSSFSSTPLTNFPQGHAFVTIFANGVPSVSATTLVYTPTPAEAWRLQNFGAIANGGNAADLEDPDGDGLTNLIERAFNLNPNRPGRQQLTSTTGYTVLPETAGLPISSWQHLENGTVLRFEYLKRVSDPSLVYIVEFSNSLGDQERLEGNLPPEELKWNQQIPHTHLGINDDWLRVIVIDYQGVGKGRRFGRVRVISSEN